MGNHQSKKVLTQMIQAGKIEAGQLPSGELLVAAEYNGHGPKSREEIVANEYGHLQDQWLTVLG